MTEREAALCLAAFAVGVFLALGVALTFGGAWA